MNNENPMTPELEPILDSKSWFDLSQYNSSFNRGKPQWFILLWWLIEAIIFPITPHNLNSFRCALLRLFGAKIGKNVVIRPSVKIYFPWKVEIGDYSWIGDQVYLYSLDKIKIGSNSIISQKCYFCTGSHDANHVNFPLIIAPIIIGNGVWIAADCFVAQGVKIGANTVIGGRSSVFKSIPAETMAWGNPCQPRKSRNFHDMKKN